MKILNKQELQIAEQILLKHTPRSLVVYGYIHTLNRNKPIHMEVVVDTWPDFKVIICRPDPQNKMTEGNLRVVSYYCMDQQILRKMLTEEDIVDFSTSFYFNGCDVSTADVIKEVLSEKGVNGRSMGFIHRLYLPDSSSLIHPAVDSELQSRISSLNLSHVDLVNKGLTYEGTDQTSAVITNLISNSPSCCITDDQGQPVSWVLLRDNCAMGMLYTVPEHRGKGYAKVVIYTMVKKLQAEGFPVFCGVAENNLISYGLFKSLGFVDSPFRPHHLAINY